MANEVVVVVRVDDQSARGFDQAQRKAKGFGNTLAAVGKAGAAIAATAVVAGVAKLTSSLQDSVQAASDLGESVNAVNQVFDGSAKEITDWSKKNANAFGLSQRAFNQMATPLGAMLKNAGLSMKDTSKWTIDLTKRASDMASVFNTDVTTALEAIQAGLRGESDPLEQFGVSLSAAKVQAEALSETGKKNAKSLTDQELATARLNLIMKQTNDVAGDFKNTSDGLANSQRILAAKTEDAQAQIGTKMLPLVLKWTQLKLALVDAITNKVLPALDAFANRKDVQAFIANVSDTIQNRIIPALSEFWSWIQSKLIPALVSLYRTHIKGLMAQLNGLIGTIQANKNEIMLLIKVAGQLAVAWMKYVAPAIAFVARVISGSLITQIRAAITIVSAFVKVVQTSASIVSGAFSRINGAARSAIGSLRSIFSGAYGAITTPFRNAINAVSSWISGLTGKINAVKSKASSLIGWLPGFANGGPVGAAANGGPRRGMIMTGENGRELVRTPAGSHVMPHSNTEQLMRKSGSGGDTNNFYFPNYVGNKQDLIDAIRLMIKSKGGNAQKVLGAN